MSIYFICKTKLTNHRITIVNNANSLEDALAALKSEALAYMNSKNQGVCDKTRDNNSTCDLARRQFYIENDPELSYVINVMCEETQSSGGWFNTNYKSTTRPVARFSYTKYTMKPQAFRNVVCGGQQSAGRSTIIETGQALHDNRENKHNPPIDLSTYLHGPAPNPTLIRELKSCELFQNLRKNTENNDIDLPPLEFSDSEGGLFEL